MQYIHIRFSCIPENWSGIARVIFYNMPKFSSRSSEGSEEARHGSVTFQDNFESIQDMEYIKFAQDPKWSYFTDGASNSREFQAIEFKISI